VSDDVRTVAPSIGSRLSQLAELPGTDRARELASLGRSWLGEGAPSLTDDERAAVVKTLLDVVSEGAGSARERLTVGAALGLLGDPRLLLPEDDAYWATVELDEGPIQFGRYLVTNREFRRFVDAGAYDDDAVWASIEGGLAWRDGAEARWPDLASQAESRPFVVDNQPVVGVTWFEAAAYAAWAGARLPDFEERLYAVRGREKRPYPWGAPFGEGNANTQEEVLGQPTAVGLYLRDRSPEGIYDLAGNVAEWCADGVDGERWAHPGAWDQPSMSAWAKARVLETPDSLSPALGFRLARDHS